MQYGIETKSANEAGLDSKFIVLIYSVLRFMDSKLF